MANEVDSEATPEKTESDHQQTTPKQKPKQRSKPGEEINLKYLAKSVISLFIPVSLCMALVVLTITRSTSQNTQDALSVQTVFHGTSEDSLANLWTAILYSLIIIGATIFVTTIFILLYIYRFYKVLIGWLMFTTFMVISFFSITLFEHILVSYNVPMDIFTVSLFHWNFGVTAMICIYWKGPLRLQQAYLIYIAARLALVFIFYLPGWTTWTFLFLISIWDIVAVLAPLGPLKLLIETAEKRNESVSPALIYSTIAYGAITVTDDDHDETEPDENSIQSTAVDSLESNKDESSQKNDDSKSTSTKSSGSTESVKGRSRRRKKRPNPNQEGIKLGLGDFIMYSVLIGKVSSYGDWNSIFACFISILTGLGMTFLLLLATRKALPGLPISIAFGLITYFFTGGIIRPFANRLLIEQIFL